MITNIFSQLRSSNSPKVKEQILSTHKDNDLLKQVLYLALSPRIKFYIKKIPSYSCSNNPVSLEQALPLLDDLRHRRKSGNVAIEHLKSILSSLSVDDAQIVAHIIQKDIKCGMGVSITNKVWKGLIEETPYMGAVPYNMKKILKLFASDKLGVVSQEKMDGRYANAIVANNLVGLESRNGEETNLGTSFDFLAEQIDSVVLNGELVIEGITRYESNGIIASIVHINKKEASEESVDSDKRSFETEHGMSFDSAMGQITMVCWDVITLDEYDNASSSCPYKERLAHIKSLVEKVNSPKFKFVDSKVVTSVADALEDFRIKVSEGKEGTILKGLSGTWKDGKPVWQCKLKKEVTLDLKIVGFNYGTKGTKNEFLISSLDVESNDGYLKTSPAGLKESDMRMITDELDVLLGSIVEVKCSGISQDSKGNYSLLHPVYIKSRLGEKSIAYTLNECITIDLSAISLQ